MSKKKFKIKKIKKKRHHATFSTEETPDTTQS
jgi:hypothetical protein